MTIYSHERSNMNAKLSATNGDKTLPVRLYHWWPGRTWKGPTPIPQAIMDTAEQKGSRYLTTAIVFTPHSFVAGVAYCCPRDVPDRHLGRTIALGRLTKMLDDAGWQLAAS